MRMLYGIDTLRCVFILRCVQETETHRDMVGYLRSALYFRKISEAQTWIWIWMPFQEAQVLPALSSQSSNKWNMQMNKNSEPFKMLNSTRWFECLTLSRLANLYCYLVGILSFKSLWSVAPKAKINCVWCHLILKIIYILCKTYTHTYYVCNVHWWKTDVHAIIMALGNTVNSKAQG